MPPNGASGSVGADEQPARLRSEAPQPNEWRGAQRTAVDEMIALTRRRRRASPARARSKKMHRAGDAFAGFPIDRRRSDCLSGSHQPRRPYRCIGTLWIKLPVKHQTDKFGAICGNR
jgi:hypothetical protein